MQKDEEELDPEDVDLDEQYTNTIETRSKCKRMRNDCSTNFPFLFSFRSFIWSFWLLELDLCVWFCFVFVSIALPVEFLNLLKNTRKSIRALKIWTPTPNSSQLKIKRWKRVADVICFVLFFSLPICARFSFHFHTHTNLWLKLSWNRIKF